MGEGGGQWGGGGMVDRGGSWNCVSGGGQGDA